MPHKFIKKSDNYLANYRSLQWVLKQNGINNKASCFLVSIKRLQDQNIIFLMLGCWFFYQVHMDGLNHASDEFISLSEGWENLKSNKYMHEMINACEIAQNTTNNSNLIP